MQSSVASVNRGYILEDLVHGYILEDGYILVHGYWILM